MLEAEGKENRKTEPEYREEEVAGDDLVVTMLKVDDDPICEKTDENKYPGIRGWGGCWIHGGGCRR